MSWRHGGYGLLCSQRVMQPCRAIPLLTTATLLHLAQHFSLRCITLRFVTRRLGGVLCLFRCLCSLACFPGFGHFPLKLLLGLVGIVIDNQVPRTARFARASVACSSARSFGSALLRNGRCLPLGLCLRFGLLVRLGGLLFLGDQTCVVRLCLALLFGCLFPRLLLGHRLIFLLTLLLALLRKLLALPGPSCYFGVCVSAGAVSRGHLCGALSDSRRSATESPSPCPGRFQTGFAFRARRFAPLLVIRQLSGLLDTLIVVI